MPTSSENPKNESKKQLLEVKEAKRHQENAKKTKEAANKLFPGEKWIKVEEGIYLSLNRPIGRKSNYKDELKDAQVLRDFGSTVYLVPDIRSLPGKKYDAIVNGLQFEFKNMHGKGISTLQEHFFSSRSQAPNVFINLENSSLTKQQAIKALYNARNNTERYVRKNRFTGGRVILKIKDHKNLIYMNVESLIGSKKYPA